MFFRKNKSQEIKPWHMYFLAIVILFALGYKVWQSIWPKATILIANQELRVLVADNFSHRYEGWSNKNDMGKYDGMLFVFPDRGEHTMVMRNMRFPLDIIWIDGDTIVDIATSAQPEPGKREAELTRYSARGPSTHVLEISAGFTQKYQVKVGDKIRMVGL